MTKQEHGNLTSGEQVVWHGKHYYIYSVGGDSEGNRTISLSKEKWGDHNVIPANYKSVKLRKAKST